MLMAVLVFAAGIYAAAQVPEVIPLKSDTCVKKGYEYTKGIVEFSHAKHTVEYAEKSPDLYKQGCGECHHDKEGKPLADLKAGDPVQNCVECHSKCGEAPKGKDAPKLSDKEKLEYHANAYHDSCRDCHKAFNKANNTKAAPTTCSKCHPKTK
jgi:hypothetical protein